MSDQTLNVPSLLLVLVLVFLTVRYFFFSPSTRSSPNRRGADPAHVEQISSMFPQVGRREIMWDLQRNGGSVAATTERILGGRGLEVVSFFRIFVPICLQRGGTKLRSKAAVAGGDRSKGPASLQELAALIYQTSYQKKASAFLPASSAASIHHLPSSHQHPPEAHPSRPDHAL